MISIQLKQIFILFFAVQSTAQAAPLCRLNFSEISKVKAKPAIKSNQLNREMPAQLPLKLTANELRYLQYLQPHELVSGAIFQRPFAASSAQNKMLVAIFLAHAAIGSKGNMAKNYLAVQLRQAFRGTENFFSKDLDLNLDSPDGALVKQKLKEIIEAHLKSLEVEGHQYNLPLLAKFIRLENSKNTEIYYNQILKSALEHQLSFGDLRQLEKIQFESIVENSLRRVFNYDFKNMIEFISIEEGVRVFSTDKIAPLEIANQNQSRSNIFSSYLLQSKNGKSNRLAFKFDGKTYEIEFSKKNTGLRPMYKGSTKFNVKYRKGEFAGAILIGNDMQDHAKLANEYKAYYQSQGFNFKRMYVQKDYAQKFRAQVKSGEINYFLKEDNGQDVLVGDVKILEGQKTTSKGVERVYIVFADEMVFGDKQPELNLENGEIIALANSAGEKDLIYVNSTCFSCANARVIAPRVTNPNFHFVGPFDLAETFTFEDSTPLMYLIDGIRKGEAFSSISKKMKQNKISDEDTDLSDNDYLFSNEKRYQALLDKNMRIGIKTSYTVKADGALIYSNFYLGSE